ncbi:hypothetical protein Ancab_032311 [Ancistrocladus abbreviatus]
MEREGGGGGWREISPSCPRCGSSNTKFCYNNNLNLTQPRHFCKGCRRCWTKGGSLWNVPVGGGCRKSRRVNNTRPFRSLLLSSSSSSSSDGGRSFASDPTGCAHYGSVINSSTNSDGSNIDLAVVYANFLNQKPQNNTNNDDEIQSSNGAGALGVTPHQLQSTEIYPMSILHGVQHPVSESINAANGTVFFHGLSNSSMSSLSSSIVGELINHEPVMGSGGYGTFGNDIGFGLQYSGGKSRGDNAINHAFKMAIQFSFSIDFDSSVA